MQGVTLNTQGVDREPKECYTYPKSRLRLLSVKDILLRSAFGDTVEVYFGPSDRKAVELSACQMKVIVIWVWYDKTCVRKCLEKGLFDQNVKVF